MIWHTFFQPFIEYGFMRRALVVCLALSVSTTALGVFLQLRRMSLMGDALSHAILPGVAVGYLLSGMSLLAMSIGGFIAGITVALVAGLVSRRTPLKEDASFAGFYLGSLALGVTLVSPQLMNAYLLGQQVPEVWNFGLFTIAKVGYQAQVIPALLAGLALGMIEARLKRMVPDYLYLVVVPVTSLILAVFLAHAFIGPFGRMIGDGVAWAMRHLMIGSFAPVGAALFGFLYAPLVITGVHQTTLAIDMQMIQSMGGTPMWPLIALSNIAQASAVTGIILVSRKHNEREISVPAAISAYLGVTEPAMYGINLKYRFPMLCAMIGSGLAALLCGLNGVMANGIGVGGLPGILSIQPDFWQVFALAMAVAIIVPMALTTVMYQRKFRQGTLQII